MIAFIEGIHWREPLWLVLAVQPLALLLLVQIKKKLGGEIFADQKLLPWLIMDKANTGKIKFIKNILLHISWFAFALAMAGPRIAEKTYTTDTSSYSNIMVLIDVSRSMSARDIHPTRLERAKLELRDLIDRIHHVRMGLTVYAAKPHLLSPLTTDKNVLRHYLSSLAIPILPTRGSDLNSALRFAANTVDDKTASQKAILLISDGEDANKTIASLQKTLSLIKENNISVYSLIAGTEYGAPLLDNESGWLTYNDKDVISKSNTNLLQEIALLTNGLFSEIKANDEDVTHLYDNGLARLNRQSVSSQSESDLVIWYEFYPWCLLVATLLFILAHLNPVTNKTLKYITLIPALIIGLYLAPAQSQASETYQQAHDAYQHQRYQQATDLFSQLSGYAARMGEASSAYQAKNYKKAIAVFIQATLEAQTDKQRMYALFNLANSYYQLTHYEQAAKIYQDVLRYQPEMLQAKINLDYAIELRKKQQDSPLAATKRGGKGATSARIEPGSDVSKGNLTLGTDSDETPVGIFSPPVDDDKATLSTALSSAGLVTQKIDKYKDTQWSYQISSVDDIPAILPNIEEYDAVFWQRLFEWEEGFPAPLTEPQSVTGVQPW